MSARKKWMTVVAVVLGMGASMAASPAPRSEVLVRDPSGDATPLGQDYHSANAELSEDEADIISARIVHVDGQLTEIRVQLSELTGRRGPMHPTEQTEVNQPKDSTVEVRTQVGGCQVTFWANVESDRGRLTACALNTTIEVQRDLEQHEVVLKVDFDELAPSMAERLRHERAVPSGLWVRAVTETRPDIARPSLLHFKQGVGTGLPCNWPCHIDVAEDPEVRFTF